jgi:hypothetical protein
VGREPVVVYRHRLQVVDVPTGDPPVDAPSRVRPSAMTMPRLIAPGECDLDHYEGVTSLTGERWAGVGDELWFVRVEMFVDDDSGDLVGPT